MEGYRDRWVALSKQCTQANDSAREARALCTNASSASAAGQGSGPTPDQLRDALTKEQEADRFAAEMASVVRAALGIR